MSARADRPALGAAVLLAGICCVAMMDATAKIASDSAPVWQIVWGRFFFHSIVMALPAFIVWRRMRGAVIAGGRGRRWGVHVLRGLLLALSSVFFFVAIRDNPVPDSLAVFFVEPLIVILMARVFLGEAFDRRLLLAAFCGLLGVLIILRPGGGGGYSWTIVFALAAAFSFAGYLVSARFASFSTPAVITSWLTAVFGLLPVMPIVFFWPETDARAWSLLFAAGALSGAGHTLIILACRYARASYVAILHYAEVGVATLISWWLFAHWPDVWVWCGIAVIAAANLYALRGGRAAC